MIGGNQVSALTSAFFPITPLSTLADSRAIRLLDGIGGGHVQATVIAVADKGVESGVFTFFQQGGDSVVDS